MRILKYERCLELLFGLNRDASGSRFGEARDHA
jgi:hypothetical protein